MLSILQEAERKPGEKRENLENVENQENNIT
jgi:hypothetical protein